MSARNVTAFIVLLLVAAGSWYLSRSLQTTELTETASGGSGEGFYLKFARILGTDDQGQLLFEIEAEFAQQQNNKEIEMQNVRIRYAAGSGVPWTISADAATISENHDLLHLRGHVSAISNEGFAGKVSEIRTEQLVIEPAAYRAETDVRVQIRIGSRSLTATGMLALLQDNRLQLKSNVSGKFMP
jgi:LPS export ABC transporter protein LptC